MSANGSRSGLPGLHPTQPTQPEHARLTSPRPSLVLPLLSTNPVVSPTVSDYNHHASRALPEVPDERPDALDLPIPDSDPGPPSAGPGGWPASSGSPHMGNQSITPSQRTNDGSNDGTANPSNSRFPILTFSSFSHYNPNTRSTSFIHDYPGRYHTQPAPSLSHLPPKNDHPHHLTDGALTDGFPTVSGMELKPWRLADQPRMQLHVEASPRESAPQYFTMRLEEGRERSSSIHAMNSSSETSTAHATSNLPRAAECTALGPAFMMWPPSRDLQQNSPTRITTGFSPGPDAPFLQRRSSNDNLLAPNVFGNAFSPPQRLAPLLSNQLPPLGLHSLSNDLPDGPPLSPSPYASPSTTSTTFPSHPPTPVSGPGSPNVAESSSTYRTIVTTNPTRAAADARRIHPARFGCAHCGQMLTTKANRDRHVLAHTGEKPYKCDCGALFTTRTDLKRHSRSTRALMCRYKRRDDGPSK
ncbi:hypothetical protein HGRIS_004433 [Hohenbuehelia grisea]|uniref:C2H2-type domain-containing protein n=1 Tax=Hohenbuehelia grisea TaxID=104357 RepID=A0ABR3JBX7_9AGAR